MDRRKLIAVGEEQHKEKSENIAHGEHLLSGKNSGYMKKELHRHHGDVSTALNFCMEL